MAVCSRGSTRVADREFEVIVSDHTPEDSDYEFLVFGDDDDDEEDV